MSLKMLETACSGYTLSQEGRFQDVLNDLHLVDNQTTFEGGEEAVFEFVGGEDGK